MADAGSAFGDRLPGWVPALAEPELGYEPVTRRWPSLTTSPAFEALREHFAPTSLRDELEPAIRHVVALETRLELAARIAVVAMLIAWLVSVAAVFDAMDEWFTDSRLDGDGIAIAVLLAGLVGCGYGQLVTTVARGLDGYASAVALLVAVAAANGAAAFFLAGGARGLGEFLVIGAAAIFNLLLLSGSLGAVAVVTFERGITRRNRAAHPAAHVFVALAEVVERLDSSATPDTRRMREVLLYLETAAATLEHDAVLGCGDFVTTAWVAGELRRRAAGLRELKRYVALPQLGGGAELGRPCGSLLVAALNGWWADFPVAEPAVAPRARDGSCGHCASVGSLRPLRSL
jgi:hypothetical protein